MDRKRKRAQEERNITEPKSPQTSPAPCALEKASTEAELTAKALSDLAEVAAVRDPKVAALIVDQVSRCSFGSDAAGLELAMEIMREMKPANLTEALLAAQMAAVHNAALGLLQQATLQVPFAVSEAMRARAAEFMRLFAEQTETLLKLKGQAGQQKVTVEHVHVHEGGQAIVGTVNTDTPREGEGGSGKKRRNTP